MRTGEAKYNLSIVFIIIAVLSYSLLAMQSYSVLDDLDSNGDFREYLEENLQETGDDIAGITMEEQIEIFGNVITFVIVVSIIYIVLGIVAAVFLAKQKRVKLIGVLLIILGGISAVLSFVLGLIGIVSSLGYLIAGVLTVVKHRRAGNSMV
ncbi:DUF4064 domain-containing protein [Oceanobacillus jeddahense]|uniref:DUF4064 domain-containing protein n=1 Tax=Oceanobacillus jeddahense TaxID=1462527 RepID=A0ABY5K0A2_9BACI|nr:DUF4064 domain-containing protein [Oceanobacillus jeddahense]UUI04522.1 DUF4064 domain-containing protein [Oceanobacillus jeddahense]